MAKRSNGFILNLQETIKQNGRLLTAFGVVAIIVSGITLVEYPQNWWIALLAVTGFFAALFLFINARAVIKAVISMLATVVLAGIAFNLGSLIEPLGAGPFVWLFGHLIVFFLCLSVSYFLPSGQSRWTCITIAVVLYFSITWLLVGIMNTVLVPAAVTVLIAVALFALLYGFGFRSRFSSKLMPQNYTAPELTERVKKAAESAELKFIDRSDKEESSYIVWGDRAYVLYPVNMEQAFGSIGRKQQILSYNGRSVNAWLRFLSFTKNPYFKARGAETMLVLVDMNNANGKEARTIGVTMPDSKAVTAVGIIPGKLLKTDEPKALEKALLHLDRQFEDFVTDLTDKQKDALSKFGVSEKDNKLEASK